MSDMRLIKKCGSRLGVRDRAYVLFNSYERGSVMPFGYMPKCFLCGGRFNPRALEKIVLVFTCEDCGSTEKKKVKVCSSCASSLPLELPGPGAGSCRE